MANNRPFAYNPSQASIPGATQVGNLAIGFPTNGFSSTGLTWSGGPDEDIQYIICYPDPSGNHKNSINNDVGYVGFLGSGATSEASYLSLINSRFSQSFVDGVNATLYLNNTLGYWSSFNCYPINTVAPAITGTNRIGSVLTVSNGTWLNSPSSYTYQWTRNSSTISGATGSTYSLVLADAAASIACNVTATNACGNTTQASGATVEGSFVSTWNTTKTSAGSSSTTQIRLPLGSTGTYSGVVYWGDGATSALAFSGATYTYASGGTYQVVITAAPGSFTGFSFNNAGDILKISSISQWGPLRLGNSSGYFYGCANLNLSSVSDVLTLTGTTNLNNLFRSCTGLTSVANINSWNVSSVTNMSYSFFGTPFNQDISGWNTSSVTTFFSMFQNATAFNQNLGAWNVSAATAFSYMFAGATAFNNGGSTAIGNWTLNTTSSVDLTQMFISTPFNQNIGNWNVSKVINFNQMFQSSSFNNGGSTAIGNWSINTGATVSFLGIFSLNTVFNQPIGNWDTSKVNDMSYMFNGASSFNQNLSNWNTSAVTNFQSTFQNATAFNNGGATGIGGWVLGTTGSINMSSMFYSASSFNQPLAGWNTSKVTNMGSMFRSATSFNQNIGSWNVTAVSDMSFMFSGASNFNNGGSNTINSWTPSLVTNFNGMFVSATSFNQPIGGWTLNNSGSLITMTNMFVNAGAFDQNIGAWNVRYVIDFTTFMSSKTPATFSTTNLDAIYSGWSGVTGGVQSSKSISFGTAKYTTAGGSTGRGILTGTYLWTITDGGTAS